MSKQESAKKKEESLEMEGVVVEALKGKFRVEVSFSDEPDAAKHELLAYLGGKMRKNYIKIVPGDKVKVEISPYDMSRGRITYRMK